MGNYSDLAVGDYEYAERDFTYTLTIAVGASTTTATFHVGEIIKATRKATTGTTANQWTGLGCITSSTNIPSCKINVTKVSNLVGSTNVIIDPHANDGD